MSRNPLLTKESDTHPTGEDDHHGQNENTRAIPKDISENTNHMEVPLQ